MRPFAPLDRQNFLKSRADKSAFFRLKKVTFVRGEGRFCDPDFFSIFFGGGVFPCDTDVGARQNGTCCCGRSRENVAQSSLGSWGSKPVGVVFGGGDPLPVTAFCCFAPYSLLLSMGIEKSPHGEHRFCSKCRRYTVMTKPPAPHPLCSLRFGHAPWPCSLACLLMLCYAGFVVA